MLFDINWLTGTSLAEIALKNLIGSVVLMIILSGGSVDINADVDKDDLQYLAGAMQIENGDNGDECLLLTGSVILNRLNSSKWNGNTIEEVIMAKDGGYWQYASVTRKGFKTKKVTKRTKMLAKYLLIFGPICPENVVYQGQRSTGSGEYKRIKVPGQKDEIFCYGTS